MLEDDCREFRRSLSLGEPEDTGDHLDRCEACRREAEMLDLVVAALQEGAVRTPPGKLDAAVRSRLGRRAAPGVPVGAAACAGLLALVSGIAALLAETGLAERGILVAALSAAVYLALSAAAALPLLLRHGALTRSEGNG